MPLGRACIQAAAASAAMLPPPLLHAQQGLWSPEFVIQRGFYCCFDALSCMDLRCELCVPGGVVAGCVDAAGVLHDATPQHFMQAQVRSIQDAATRTAATAYAQFCWLLQQPTGQCVH
jgi:hypothetical protein